MKRITSKEFEFLIARKPNPDTRGTYYVIDDKRVRWGPIYTDAADKNSETLHQARDPHLPPPEVCDWLLAQEWSKSMDVTVSCVESWSAKSGCQAIAAIGRDEYIDLMLPVEALQLLKEDAAAREQSRADESDGEKLDPETTLLQRVLADAEQAEISAFSAIGVLTTAATMMVSQCYDLTKLGDDHADA